MGLFDIFNSKKKQEEEDAVKLLQALIEHQATMRKDSVETDDIPSAFGPYGLCKTNPIPTRSVPGSNEYLARLRTVDGLRVEANRLGSTSATEVTSGMIDIYNLTANGRHVGQVFICPYHKRNSERAPEGFKLA